MTLFFLFNIDIMSTKTDLFYASNQAIPDEKNPRITRNGLLFPISKAYLEEYPNYYDFVRAYEAAIEQIPEMIESDRDHVINRFINVDENRIMHLKINMINNRLYSPNSTEACTLNEANMLSPTIACAKQGTYSLTLASDIHYEYLIIDKRQLAQNGTYIDEFSQFASLINTAEYVKGTIPNGYVVGIPLMLGSKWCTTRQFDPVTLIKSGEDLTGYYGYFIIEGYIRHMIPSLKKPLNKPIIVHNEFDKQLARVEIQYSRSCDYENSYYMVGAMLMKDKIQGVQNGIECNDFGFSLQLNHPKMNLRGVKKNDIKELFNFVPIRILFAAFGCQTDKEFIDYICPDHSNISLITCVMYASLYGFKHHEAYVKANIDLIPTAQGFMKLAEPLTKSLARYIIGRIILKPDTLDELRTKSKGSEAQFRLQVKLVVDAILGDRFMPAIGDNSDVDRDTAVCITLGGIVSELYMIGMNLHESQSKQSLTNKRFSGGQPFVKQFGSFHVPRLNLDLVSAITEILNVCDRQDFNELFYNTLENAGKKMSAHQTSGMINVFKDSGVKEAKIRNEIIEPKNQLFIWNKVREVAKNSDIAKRNVRDNWNNRQPHPSEYGYLCPTETPDSANVLKFRCMGIHTTISHTTSQAPIKAHFKANPAFKVTISGDEIRDYYTVSVNGSIIGYLHQFDDVENEYKTLLKLRSQGPVSSRYTKKDADAGLLPCDLTIVLNNMQGKLDVWCDVGRLITPFVNVRNCFTIDGKVLRLKREFASWLKACDTEPGHFWEGVKAGFVDMLDCEMLAHNFVLASSMADFSKDVRKYTHVSMNASMDGLIVAANPCSALTSGVKSGMATNHLKQAMGAPGSKYPQLLFQNLADYLIEPQQPLVQPAMYRFMHCDKVPIGQNVTVCFIQMKYNQDDATIFNRESVENGFLTCDTFTNFRVNDLKNDEKFMLPTKSGADVLTGNPFSYDKLGESSCLPKEISSLFYTGDALIGEVKVVANGTGDMSIINKMPDAKNTINQRPMRCIETNYLHEQDPNLKMLMTGQYRVCVPGDKVNIEHGQKQTIGTIIDPERLPMTSTGRRADVYMSPLSIFKRKTYSASYFAMIMKIAALHGCFLENSTYGTIRTPEELEEVLRQANLDGAGFETFYDPETGDELPGLFFGFVYYERQHHMLETKINIVSYGPREATYNQPTHGKANDGGLMVDGRLSNNGIRASGANNIYQDFHQMASKMDIGFCRRCGSPMAFKDGSTGEWKCQACGMHEDIDPKVVSCSFPLFNHIMTGIGLGIEVDQDDH